MSEPKSESHIAFSNGTEWDAWSSGWCRRCTKYDRCEILDRIFLHGDQSVPPEWTEEHPNALGPSRYSCADFEEMSVLLTCTVCGADDITSERIETDPVTGQSRHKGCPGKVNGSHG